MNRPVSERVVFWPHKIGVAKSVIEHNRMPKTRMPMDSSPWAKEVYMILCELFCSGDLNPGQAMFGSDRWDSVQGLSAWARETADGIQAKLEAFRRSGLVGKFASKDPMKLVWIPFLSSAVGVDILKICINNKNLSQPFWVGPLESNPQSPMCILFSFCYVFSMSSFFFQSTDFF